MRRMTTAALLMTVGVVLGSACGGGGGTNPPPPPPPPGSPSMAKASNSGDGQSAALGTVLPNPLRVLVTQGGNPVSGQAVVWSVAPTGGLATPTTVNTGADGIATTSITLPPIGGAVIIEATAAGVTNSPLGFTATATGASLAVTVQVSNTFFSPNVFNLRQGGIVTFLWSTGSGPHSVTPVAPNTIPASANPPVSHNAPHTFDTLFPNAGVFKFFCTVHGAPDTGMHGTITVVP